MSSLDNSNPNPNPNADDSARENPLLRPSNLLVSDLEQQVLDEYSLLLGNVNKASSVRPSALVYSRLLT